MSTRVEWDEAIDDKVKAIVEGMDEGWHPLMKSFCNYMRNDSANTRKSYMTNVREFVNYFESKGIIDPSDEGTLSNVKPYMIDDCMADLDYTTAKKNAFYYGVKKFWNFLYMNEIVQSDIFARLKSAKDTKEHKIVYLEDEEIKKVMNVIEHPAIANNPTSTKARGLLNQRILFKNQNRLLFSLAIETGLRRSSIYQIELKDIDFDHQRITVVQKGDKIHVAVYSGYVASILEDWLKDRENILLKTRNNADTLFLNPNGTALTPKSDPLGTLLRWCTCTIKKKITPHKLRSTCATMILDKTGNIALASKVLGHANVTTTQRYARVMDDKIVSIAEELGNVFS